MDQANLMLPLVERYRPRTRKELVGNKKSIDAIYSFVENWGAKGVPKALLLVGPPGTGKTSAVLAVANDFKLNIVEFNSSDSRRRAEVQDLIAPLMKTSTLNFESGSEIQQVVLIDEVDGMHGNFDRGGVAALSKALKTTSFPVIMTANDIESSQVKSLSRVARVLEFVRLDELSTLEMLEEILEKERANFPELAIDEEQLELIAERSGGDIRAALNELESYLNTDGEKFDPAVRNRAKVLVDILNDVYSARSYDQARGAVDRTTSDYFMFLQYVYDTAHRECRSKEELLGVYQQIAMADLILARIVRSQDYSTLKYFFELLGPGIFLSKEPSHRKTITSVPNLPLSLIARGRYKQVNKTAITVAPKVAPKLHIPQKRFIIKEFRYLVAAMRGKDGAYLAAWLDLTDDEVELVTKLNKDQEIYSYLEEAREKVGAERAETGQQLAKKVDYSVFDQFLDDAFFEDPLPAKKKKRKRKKAAKNTKPETKKEDGEKEVKVEGQEPEDQLSLDDFF